MQTVLDRFLSFNCRFQPYHKEQNLEDFDRAELIVLKYPLHRWGGAEKKWNEPFFSVAGKLHDVSSMVSLSTVDVLTTACLSEKEISAYLIVQFGVRRVHVLRSASKVTQVYQTHHLAVIRKRYPQLSDIPAEELQNAILLADKLSTNKRMEVINCFRPPTNNCMDCGRELELHNKPTEVMFFSLKGSLPGKKISLRCSHCKIYYKYSTYGKKESRFKFMKNSYSYYYCSLCTFLF